MSEKKFDFKSLFIKDEGSNSEELAVTSTSSGTFFTPSAGVVSPTDPIFDKVRTMYRDGFEKLNQPGYDFFEFFKALIKFDTSNPQTFVMAFQMASSMNSGITKQHLLAGAKHYVDEISKVHSTYAKQGSDKMSSLGQQRQTEESALRSEVQQLRDQITLLTQQLNLKEQQITGIDQKYAGQLNELQTTLAANDTAKNELIGSIQQVVTGIEKNIN